MANQLDGPTEPEVERYGRLPWLRPEQLSAAQRSLYERLTSSPRATSNRASPLTDEIGRLFGPFNAMLTSPEVGAALQEVGTAIRFRGTLPDRVREIAILEVARTRRCAVEWRAHAHAGRRVGLRDDELQAISDGRACPTFDAEEGLARRIVRSLLLQRDLDDHLVSEIEQDMGLEAAAELLMLVGYYDFLALSLQVWRTPDSPAADAGEAQGATPELT